jgi:hypothetical protein
VNIGEVLMTKKFFDLALPLFQAASRAHDRHAPQTRQQIIVAGSKEPATSGLHCSSA